VPKALRRSANRGDRRRHQRQAHRAVERLAGSPLCLCPVSVRRAVALRRGGAVADLTVPPAGHRGAHQGARASDVGAYASSLSPRAGEPLGDVPADRSPLPAANEPLPTNQNTSHDLWDSRSAIRTHEISDFRIPLLSFYFRKSGFSIKN
jgi:hypothetical protein